MRLSTAGTLALTILLATSALVAVVAAPSVAALEPDPVSQTELEPEPNPTAADQFASDRVHGQSRPMQTVTDPSASATAASQPSLAAESEPLERADPQQVLRINVSESGHAEWTIESRFNLTDEDDVEAFREYAAAVAAGSRGVEYDLQQFRSAAAAGERATGRQMAIENPGWNEPRIESVDAGEANENDAETRVGVISYSFTWTNFARVDDDRIRVGDVFHAPEEPMLERLLDGQRLVIEYPPHYALETPTQLEWDGPHEFEDGELEIVFVRGPGGPALPAWLSTGPVGLAGAGLGLVLIGASAGYLAYRYRQRREDGESGLGLSLPGPLAALTRSESEPADAGRRASETEAGASDVDDAPQSPADAVADAGTHIEFEEDDEEIDPELLSDEERVHRMLKRNGGRMKQANIVKETGWSNAKVSQLLSQMDEDGQIEKLRIGRENLITLPEVDPTEVD